MYNSEQYLGMYSFSLFSIPVAPPEVSLQILYIHGDSGADNQL
jgi:hypothetical protein